MTDRVLLFDVGNTRIKWGVLEPDDQLTGGSLTHETLREKGIDALTRKLPRRVAAAYACNVAGADVGARLARVIGIHIGGDLRFVKSERRFDGLVNGYSRPRTLGVDRWVAMIGARATWDGPLCVVDAGTAVTIDAIEADGTHLGGQILPGLRLMTESLARDTSDIGRVTESRVANLPEFGNTTRRAVLTGTLAAIAGAVERAVNALQGNGLRPQVVLTGGDASRILPLLDDSVEHNSMLVLDGLAEIARSNP